jgi:anti-sigma regulatory factor (Ser/Thr protein kinase)
VTLDGGMFSVLIQNDGKPVTSGTRVPDALEASESLNWGLYLIGRMMDEVEITRSTLGDTGTAIRMSKSASPPNLGWAPRVEEAWIDQL